MKSEVAEEGALGQRIFDEAGRDRREQYLTPMGYARDAGGTMHLETKKAGGILRRLLQMFKCATYYDPTGSLLSSTCQDGLRRLKFVRLPLGSRGPIQSLQEGRRPDLAEDVSSLLSDGGVRVI